MPRPCSICTHEARSDIDDLVVGSVSYRDIQRQFDVTPSALTRHRREHLSPALVALQAERITVEQMPLVSRLSGYVERMEQLLGSGEARTRIGAIREARQLLELIARLTGELDERPQSLTVNIAASAEWSELRSAILGALAPFPEARAAVVRALTSGPVIEG